MLGKRKPGAGPGLGEDMSVLRVRETVEVIPGFGVTYQVRRRTWLLFGIIPLVWAREIERR